MPGDEDTQKYVTPRYLIMVLMGIMIPLLGGTVVGVWTLVNKAEDRVDRIETHVDREITAIKSESISIKAEISENKRDIRESYRSINDIYSSIGKDKRLSTTGYHYYGNNDGKKEVLEYDSGQPR